MVRSDETDAGSILRQGTAYLALVLSAVGLAGSLYLSIGLGLRACPLCFYQRTFVMAVFAVLAVGLLVDRNRAGLLCLLSVPMAGGGLGVAGFHEYLVLADKLECPAGLFQLGTAPAQSLTLFVLLIAAVGAGAWIGRAGPPPAGLFFLAGAAILGGLLAWGAIASAPPMPVRTTPYPDGEPFNTCRPPYRPG